MENNQPQKLGAGIIIISLINLLLGAGIGLLSSLLYLFARDTINEQLKAAGQPIVDIPQSQLIISLVLSLVLAISLILILLKKSIGVYAYFACIAISVINSAITSGVDLNTFSSLVLPLLLGYFIYQKKELFGFGNNKDNSVM